VEQVRQIRPDVEREQRLAAYLESVLPWVLIPTPKFYFTDYHINRRDELGRENYIGDLELKWLNIPSTVPAVFPFNKLQLMAAVPVYRSTPESYHRICMRYTDGLLLLPALALLRLPPVLHTRADTGETDMVVKVRASEFRRYFKSERVE